MLSKKILPCLIILSLLLTSCTFGIDTESNEPRAIEGMLGYRYDTIDKVAVTDLGDDVYLEKYENVDADLILPTMFADEKVINHVGESAFMDDDRIVTLTIPDGYLTISFFSFMYCDNLETVYIGKDLYEIGDGAFEGSNSIKEFIVSEDNPHMYSTQGCVIKREGKVLLATNGAIPPETEQIYHSVFREREDISAVVLPEKVNYIGGYAFANSSLSSIELPECLNTIEKGAFMNTTLTEICIPANVVNINEAVFSGVNGITINCEAESKPETWDDEWLKGCIGYQVNWGVKAQ